MSQCELPPKQKHHTKTFADHIGITTKLYCRPLDKRRA